MKLGISKYLYNCEWKLGFLTNDWLVTCPLLHTVFIWLNATSLVVYGSS